MNLLILYPKEFNCYSKFRRKIENILSDKVPRIITYTSDPNNFIDTYANEFLASSVIVQTDKLEADDITHAIIFDDGEEFSNETMQLKEKQIATRRIKIKITRVINIKNEPQYKEFKSTNNYEYIGRGSYWGNPHSMYEKGASREEVIRKFKYDFDFDKFPYIKKTEVYKLSGKRLGCFCKPAICHGDVLADFLNSWDDGE